MSRPLREEEIKEKFRQYFVKLRRKMNFQPDLEEVLWLHLKAIGLNTPDKFDEGVENFGYKL